MQEHLILIVRYITCVVLTLLALVVIFKVGDNHLARLLMAALAAVLVYFNEEIGSVAYLMIGSTVEAMVATMGVLFVLILAAVLCLFPIIAVIHWLSH